MNQVLFTFDYELFLGKKSGTVEKCLIEPTDIALRILQTYNLKGLFFVDALYLHRLLNVPGSLAKLDYSKIESQLHHIVNSGHTVGIHIHPHWIDAVYKPDSNNWDGENKQNFALSCLSESRMKEVIYTSYQSLKSWLPDSEPITFRAGGFYAQPFDRLISIFKELNILYDFSVMREFRSTGFDNLYSFDYSQVPEQMVYTFNSNPLLAELGDFVEISVNPFLLEGLNKIRNSIYYRRNKGSKRFNRIGDGTGSGNIIQHHADATFMRFWRNYQTYSIELLNPVLGETYVRDLLKNHYVHWVSHPKLFTEVGLDSFEDFCKKINKLDDLETDYRKIIQYNLQHTS